MCQKAVKYAGLLALLTLCFVPVSWGQISGVRDGVYTIDIFQNVQTLDGLKKVVNDGLQGDTPGTGNLCDLIYVFNQEQMSECCGCVVTPNGSRDFDVKRNLTSNPLTGRFFNEVVVKEISSGPIGASSDSSCNPTVPLPTAGLHSWAIKTEVVGALKGITETVSPYADLGPAEFSDLAEDCGVLIELGSGLGVCSCGTFD